MKYITNIKFLKNILKLYINIYKYKRKIGEVMKVYHRVK